MTKKRIVILSVIVIGVAAAIYGASVATNNFAILAVSPLVLGFIACPLMCAVMGGGMWLMSRFSKNKDKGKTNLQKNDCGCKHSHTDENLHENKLPHRNSNKSIKQIANTGPENNAHKSRDLNPFQSNSNSKFKIFRN